MVPAAAAAAAAALNEALFIHEVKIFIFLMVVEVEQAQDIGLLLEEGRILKNLILNIGRMTVKNLQIKVYLVMVE